MNFPLFIARRIYGKGAGSQKVAKPAIRIATAGVAIGLAVMIVTVSVILGFKHTIRDKVVGFGSHITVANIASLMSSDQYPIQMDDSMTTVLRAIPGVRHVERYAMTQGILKTDDDFLGVALKGVGPEYDTTFIHQNLVEGSIPHFSDSSSTQRLLISKTIADQLRVKCGERIFAYFINHQGVRTRRFTITGIYETNLKQYDQQMCFTDLYTANRLNGWQEDQFSGAEMLVHDFGQIDEVEHQVVKRVNRTTDHYGETYSSATVTEMNPQIFSWLELMDLNVWLILGLMIAVAIVTMVSGLLIIILERTQMIGVLKALGAKNQQVRHVFLGQRLGPGPHRPPAPHGLRAPRSPDLLCQHGPRGDLLAHRPGPQRGHAPGLRCRPRRPLLPCLSYPSRQEHALRVGPLVLTICGSPA